MSKPYRMCSRCVMDTSDPDITFDDQGVCCHCHRHDALIRRYVFAGEEGRRRVERIVQRIKREGSTKRYDCVIGVSGGVDSTFVAHTVKALGLRPLAVHLDNGWDSELAVKNIEQTMRILGIDLHTHVLDWEEFRDLQVAFLRASTPDSEIPSDHAIVSLMCLMAREVGVRHIVTGNNLRTETHLPPAWSQGHMDWRYIRSVHERFGTKPLRSYPHLSLWKQLFVRVTMETTNLLDYLDYSKTEAMSVLERELGWKYYGGKHYESVYTRWYQGYWLPRKFGYDKRRMHLSSLICSGELTRAEALDQLQAPTYDRALQEQDTAYVIKKLGLTEEELERLAALPKRSYWDFPSYGRIYRSGLYRGMQAAYRAVKWRR